MVVTDPPASQAVDLDSIVAAHLFGEYVVATQEAAGANDRPEPPLDVTLLGILAFSASSSGHSRVLLASEGDSGKGYAAGDSIGPGVSVQSIFPDHVNILHRGRIEVLWLTSEGHSADGNGLPIANSQSPDALDLSPEQSVMAVKNQLAKDPASVPTFIRMQPNVANGQIHGMRVFPGKNRALFDNTGLRPGDIVLSLNGIHLDDATSASQVVGALAHAATIAVVVDRGDHAETLHLMHPD